MLSDVKRAVMFAAHTDDEMVCAGTLHRLARQGCEVHVVTFGPAGTQQDPDGNRTAEETVYDEWVDAMRLIGVARPRCTLYRMTPSKSLHVRGQEVADYAFRYVNQFNPDVAFVLSPEDENPAHAEVGRQCERVMRGRVPLVLRCQFPWNLSYGRRNVYVRLSPEDLDVKRKVIEAYKSQAFRYDYSMFLDYARADGKSVKAEACETFELVRGVV